MTVLFKGVRVWRPGGISEPLDVLVKGAHVAAIGRVEEPAGAEVIEGGHHLLAPGLINAHFHSPANHLKGLLRSMPLELFMLYESPVDEQLRPSPREAYVRTLLGALEMLRSGTTSVQDDAFLMPGPEPDVVDAVMGAYRDCGIRATVALDQSELAETDKLPFLADQPGDDLRAPAPVPRRELLEQYDHLFCTWHGTCGDRLRAAVSVSAPQRVSVEYFEALEQISRSRQVPLFAHMLETKAQRVLATEQPRFGGRSLVRYTADLGLLNERTNIIHAVWVDDDDLDLIAAAGATVIHNPVSNLRLGSGIMPFRAVRRRGIPVALGVDEAICNDAVDMWSVVRAAGLVHNVTGQDPDAWPTAGEVLEALWQGGAAAMLRSGDLGEVRVGALADLVLIDLHSLAFTPLNDVDGQLVYCENGSGVALTMVNGAVVARDGRVTTVDADAILTEARELFAAKRHTLERSYGAVAAGRARYEQVVRRAAAADVGFTRWAGSL